MIYNESSQTSQGWYMNKSIRRKKHQKNVWQIQEAKAKFSQLVEEATENGYQTITKQGVPVAVILSKKAFDQITRPKSSFLNFFKNAPCQDVDLDISRSKDFPRDFE